MKPNIGKALVLGDSARSFLAVIRSLGRRGVRVHVAWCPANSAALRSRYIRRVHDIPLFSPCDGRWKDDFIALCGRERFDLILPCHDDVILPLQRHRGELCADFPVYLLAPAIQAIVSDKEKTHALAESVGVPTPRQMILEGAENPDLMSTFEFPCVIKPLASVRLDDLAVRHEVVKVYNEREFRRHLASTMGRTLVQEHVPGIGVGVEVLARQGTVLFAFQHVRIHERIGGGPSSYRRASTADPALLAAAQRMTAKMGYTGVAMFEFRKDFASGQWAFLEINGRFWGSLPLPVAAGADFPFFLYQMLVEGRTDFSAETYRTDIYCRNLLLDLAWMAENAAADRSDPTRNVLPFSRVIREVRHLMSGRERWDAFTWDDPMPGLAEIRQKARYLKHPAQLWIQ